MFKKILIADSNDATFSAVAYTLAKSGFKSYGAKCGQTAISRFFEISPSLLVLNTELDLIDGFEVYKTIRLSTDKCAKVPVLFITSNLTDIIRIASLELGKEYYITKPFSPSELLTRIRIILSNQHQQLIDTKPFCKVKLNIYSNDNFTSKRFMYR